MPRKKSQGSLKLGPRAPRGQVGIQTYEQVRKIAEEKSIPLVKAFEEVAAATGRKPGTIAVTYYRFSRERGSSRTRQASPQPQATPGRRGRKPKAHGVVQTIMSRVSAAITELEGVIIQQVQEIERLRGESALADRIRKALRD